MKLYNVKRKNLIWNTIFPLNKLEDKYPELYKKYKEIYNWREEMMNIIIPKMNCKFNDVIQMSPINPKIILDEMKKIWFKIDYEINIFEIESNILNSNNLFIFKYKWWKVKFTDKEIISFNENYFKNTELSEFTKEYYKECYKLLTLMKKINIKLKKSNTNKKDIWIIIMKICIELQEKLWFSILDKIDFEQNLNHISITSFCNETLMHLKKWFGDFNLKYSYE